MILGPYVNANPLKPGGYLVMSEREIFGSNYIDDVKYKVRAKAGMIASIAKLEYNASGQIVFDKSKFIQTQQYIMQINRQFKASLDPLIRTINVLINYEPHTRVKTEYLLPEKQSLIAKVTNPGIPKGKVFVLWGILFGLNVSYLEMCRQWYIWSTACDMLNTQSGGKLSLLIK